MELFNWSRLLREGDFEAPLLVIPLKFKNSCEVYLNGYYKGQIVLTGNYYRFIPQDSKFLFFYKFQKDLPTIVEKVDGLTYPKRLKATYIIEPTDNIDQIQRDLNEFVKGLRTENLLKSIKRNK